MKHLFILFSLFFIQHTQAQTWTNIGPDFGGYFREFTFHPSNSNIIFAGGDDASGIWKSTDGGQNWQLVSEELPNMSAWHIEMDKNNPNIMYACDLYNRYGVAKSTDGGENWTTSANGLINVGARTVSKLAVYNQDTLFISTGLQHDGRTGDGIYKSIDGGINWIASGLQGLTCPAVVHTSINRLMAATQGQGLKYSDNLGVSWQNHPDISLIDTLSQVEVKDSFIVVVSKDNGIYVSSDNGLTFTNIGGGAYDIAIGNTQPNLTIYSSGLIKTEYNYGSQTISGWISMYNTSLIADTVLYMGIGAKNDTVMLGQLGNSKLSISTNGGNSWTKTTTSPSGNYINDITVDPTDDQHIFASLVISNTLGLDKECLIETTDGGLNWVRKGPKASGYKIKFQSNGQDTLLCGTFTDGLFKSVDGGNTWINKRPISWVTDIIYHPDYPNEVLIAEVDNILNPTSAGIFKSADGGETFSSAFSAANLVTKIIHIPNSDSTVAATLWNGLYLSTDRGNSFNPWILSGDSIKTVAYRNGNTYAGSEAGQLYKTSSSGTQNITGPWQQLTEITNIYFRGDTLLVGLNGAEHDRDTTYNPHGSIWASYDFGQNWMDISSNLPCTQFFGNDVFTELNGKLMVGTYGGSFFTLDALPLGIFTSAGMEQSLSVYPNPFDENENVTVLIPEKIRNHPAEVRIYDVHGKLIYTLSGSGNDNMQLDLKNLDKGIYLVQLISEKNNMTFNTKIIKQ